MKKLLLFIVAIMPLSLSAEKTTVRLLPGMYIVDVDNAKFKVRIY